MAETKNGIKYPDSYDSVADIPKDLKSMAESTDAAIEKRVEKVEGQGLSEYNFSKEYKEKLDGLSNYDDTEIKKDISNIQKEQETQNDDIDALKAQKKALEKEVQSLKEDAKLNGLTEDNEGELINITNTTGARFNSLEICGNDKQFSQDGTSNLLVLEEGSKTENGVTVAIENGEVTISGTATANTQLMIGKAYLYEGETYYIEKHGTSKNTGFRLQNPKIGSQQHWFSTSGETSFAAETTGEWELLMSTNEAQNPSATNLKLRVSKESGIEWEQGFINTPSFDYPSEVKCVGDNINLFSTDFYDDFSNNSGATHETIDDMIKVSTSSINQFSGIFLYTLKPNIIELDNIIKGKTVTYSFEAKADDNIDLSFGKSGNSFIRQVKKEWRKYSVTYPNTSNSSIYFYNNSATVTNFYIRKIKLEYGEIDSSYSPHELGSVGLKIFNKNFNDNVFEIGTIMDDTGKEGTSKNYIRSKNYLSLDSGDYTIFAYKFSGVSILNTAIRLYDKNKKYLRSLYIGRIDANVLTFKITEDVYFGRLVCLNNETVSSDFSVEIQIEKGTTKTNYEEHEEQTYVVPVQQKMLKGDKFIKINGKRKEQHTWLELVFDGVNRQFNHEGTGTSGKNRLLYHITEKVKNCNTINKIIAYCSNSKLIAEGATYSCNIGFTVANNIIYMYVDGREASEINAELQDNPITFYIPLQEDSYQYLDCTPEQVEVLDKIEQEAHTYEGVTNVCTEDEVGAIIKTNTAVDLKTVINNVVEAQLQEIGG